MTCTFTQAGQMLVMGHSPKMLKMGRLWSLGKLKDFEEEARDVAVFQNGRITPGEQTNINGKCVSLTTSTAKVTEFPYDRKVFVSLEDHENAEDMIAALKVVTEAQHTTNHNIDSLLLKDIDIEMNLDPNTTHNVIGVHNQQGRVDENEYEDYTNTPPSEYDLARPSGSIQLDMKRLSSAYSDATPALRIIMEELHKVRAEQARHSQRQETLQKQVQLLSEHRARQHPLKDHHGIKDHHDMT